MCGEGAGPGLTLHSQHLFVSSARCGAGCINVKRQAVRRGRNNGHESEHRARRRGNWNVIDPANWEGMADMLLATVLLFVLSKELILFWEARYSAKRLHFSDSLAARGSQGDRN